MLVRFFLTLWLLVFSSAVQAQSEAIEGRWDFRVDSVTIFRFEIERVDAQEWRGTWSRPDSFATDGYAFARLSGGVETIPSMTGITFDEKVELSFDDPRPGAVPDIFRFEQIDYSHLRMTYVGTDLPPFDMVRAGPGDGMGGWDSRRVYTRARPDAGLAEQAPVVAQPSSGPAGINPVVVAGSVAPADDARSPEAPGTMPTAGESPAAQTAPIRSRVGADFLDGL